MDTAWKVAAATAVVGWLVSPIIAFFLPKVLSWLGFDASEKLQELEFNIIPELQETLQEVDQKRMLQRGDPRRVKSEVATLDKMAAMLRHAREEAEDIVDDHEEIELYRNRCWQGLCGAMKACPGIVRSGSAWLLRRTRRNSCLQRLYGAVKACIVVGYRAVARCLGVVPIVRSGLSRPLQWAWNWFKEPVLVNAASHNHVGVTIDTAGVSVSHEEATTSVPVTAPSCSSLDLFKSCCRSILYLLLDMYEKACIHRDLFYKGAGITSNQENATSLDFLLTAVSRRDLKKRIEKIESIISEVKKSTLLGVASKSTPDDVANKNRSKIRTSSNRKVFGREGLRDSIMGKLREKPHGTSPCYSVIGIYGVAGSGKTTFARYIRDYIEKECKEENLFDTIMCIHVSENFSVDDIFHEMLKDVTKGQHSNISDRVELEVKLKKSLHGKRFFLILDDLWVKNKNDPQLEELISPLKVGLKGSKILVTARTKDAAGALCADKPLPMPDLDEDQYLSMFMHYALCGTTSVNDEGFKRVGSVIARKLHGSPIAAVIVAGRLGANREIGFWENIAERDMLNDTMDALWWSYQQLSSDIKRCFKYCNIFPRRFGIKRGHLVHLWIAQGYLKTSCGTEDMEDVAEGYIQELVSCSFLQPEKTWMGEEVFRIHDLLHDLADMVTRTDCFRIENESGQRAESWKQDIPRDVRHLFIQNYDAELITEKILGLGNLRTLIINVVGRDTQVEEVIDSVCKKLQKLRVFAFALSEAYIAIKEQRELSVPESVGQLKHLRYLAVRTDSGLEIILPSTLNKLQHIQILDFGDGKILEFTFAELVNLRHILHGHVNLLYVGKLSSLQSLPDFQVSNEQGCELKQLRGLNKLRGKLCISGLENVKSKDEAHQANLAAKERLTDLSLMWSYDADTSCSPEVEADVLKGMCPPVGLQKLHLLQFAGWRYPDWMVGKNSGGPEYLQELLLWRCSLPLPGSGLAEAFPHLRALRFWCCGWDVLPVNMEHLTSLKELWIISCENIWSLPSLPQSLEVFRVRFCNAEFTKSCETVGHPNWQKIEHIHEKEIW